jgi:hypothetical protein
VPAPPLLFCQTWLPAAVSAAQVMSREMFNPQFSLFQPVPEGGTTFQVSSRFLSVCSLTRSVQVVHADTKMLDELFAR